MLNPDNPTSGRLRGVAATARWVTVLLFVVTFVGTHYPRVVIPIHFHAADKVMHCLIYAVLSFAVLTSWELSVGLLRPQHYFTVWLLGTLYGAFDEVTQIPVGRNCDGLDWLSDILGIVIGLTLFRLLRPLFYRVAALSSNVA